MLVDDMGYSDPSVAGSRHATPHIDALARDGLVMTRFYDTSPICSPSRAGFMTGRFPARSRSSPPLQGILREAGYVTGQFGKWLWAMARHRRRIR